MTSKHFIVGFGIFVAAIAVFSIYLSSIVERTDRSVTAVLSPDKKMKAVRLTLEGHGRKPFCIDSVSVMLSAYPDEFAASRKEYEVYSGPCARFAGGADSPKVEWRSPTELQISYAASVDARPSRRSTRKTIDVTKSVHINFAPAP